MKEGMWRIPAISVLAVQLSYPIAGFVGIDVDRSAEAQEVGLPKLFVDQHCI